MTIKTSDYDKLVNINGELYDLKGIVNGFKFDETKLDAKLPFGSSVTITDSNENHWKISNSSGNSQVWLSYVPHSHKLSCWISDGTTHWRNCLVCGEQFICQNWCQDGDEDGICNVCGGIVPYHDVTVKDSEGGKITPYTNEIPVTARKALLELLHTRVYEDFGGLDVHCVSANSTNDHLDAAYEPMNQNADDFEAQIKPFIRQICALAGFGSATPTFNRSRIVNTAEQVATVISEAAIIGQDMAIDLLPNLTPEQKKQAKAALMAESETRETVDEEDDGDET